MIEAVNLNADLGEGFGAYSIGNDQAMLDIVKSANIACGFHGGDPLVIRRTVRLACNNQVSIGAHPSFPDLQGFGRRPMSLSDEELESIIGYQIGALIGIAKSVGGSVTHVKPHGALNNMAAVDLAIAKVVVRAVQDLDAGLILLAPARSRLVQAGREAGLTVAEEIFADRGYGEEGDLLPRSMPGSVHHDVQTCVDQIVAFLRAGAIITRSGKHIPTDIHSICVHGDSPMGVSVARTILEVLESNNIEVHPLPKILESAGRTTLQGGVRATTAVGQS
ncbi:MAG: 5-oxoprolinase subunit PxpA [Gammaproteobacteria bacterium]|nr:5-oxoprolinase subunit PxpA [Gammaproteobacteria bacterium]